MSSSSRCRTAMDAEGQRWQAKHCARRQSITVERDDEEDEESLFDSYDSWSFASSVMSDVIFDVGNKELSKAFEERRLEEERKRPCDIEQDSKPTALVQHQTSNDDDTTEPTWYQGLWRIICTLVKNCVDRVKGWFAKVWEAIKKFFSKIRDEFTKFIKWLISQISGNSDDTDKAAIVEADEDQPLSLPGVVDIVFKTRDRMAAGLHVMCQYSDEKETEPKD